MVWNIKQSGRLINKLLVENRYVSMINGITFVLFGEYPLVTSGWVLSIGF